MDKSNETIVAEYMSTLSLLQRDKEEVSNVILGYMSDCQMKDNEIEVLNKKLKQIQDAFPKLDTPDIYDESYCCEWNLSRDRKRLHEIINS